MSDYFPKTYKTYSKIPNLALENYSFDSVQSYALDLKIKTFLENYYQTKLSTKQECEKQLNMWHYEALASICQYAKENSLFYKDLDIEDLFDIHKASALPNEEIKSRIKNTIQRLPFTQSSDISMQNHAFLALSQDEVQGIVSVETSGTSSSQNKAKKKQVYSSQNDFESTIQFFFFGMQYILKDKDDKVALLISSQREGSIGHLFTLAMQRMQVACKVIGFSTDYKSLVEETVEFKATCLVALSWHVLKFSSYIKEHAIKHCIKKVLLSGDTASKALKKRLAQNLSCEVFNHYGITETGFAGAVECEQHKGMHVRALDLYLEIIDDKLKPVNDGEFGEVVVTTLTREAMPLIRYRTGDRGRILPRLCTCDSFVPLIEIEGRMSQGVQINREIFLHLTDFQDFFFNHAKFECIDFNICLYNDTQSDSSLLIVGIETVQDIDNNEEKLKECEEDFISYFKLKLLPYREKNNIITEKKAENSVQYIYFCSLHFYNELVFEQCKTNTMEKENLPCDNVDSFDAFIQKDKQATNLNTKKIIHFAQGNFSDKVKSIRG